MKIGRIIGRVVSTQKVEDFEGLKLTLVQTLDEKLEKIGDPIVAVDNIQSNVGDLVYFETSVEAAKVFETFRTPVDATVMAIIDNLNIEI
jgi:microcompartment protein CcmK/EutM